MNRSNATSYKTQGREVGNHRIERHQEYEEVNMSNTQGREAGNHRMGRTQYEDVNKISYGNSISINPITNVPDTIPCLMLNWGSSIKNIDAQQEKLRKWLQIRLDLDTLQVIRY